VLAGCPECPARWRTTPRCAASPRPQWANDPPCRCRRTCAARVPSRLPLQSGRPRTVARIRRRHRPAECHGSGAGAFADARPCGWASSDTTLPVDRDWPQGDHRARKSITVRSWSCRGRDRAPAPACRRRALCRPPTHSDRARRPTAPAGVLRRRPTSPTSRDRGPRRNAGRYPVADTAGSGRRTWPR
jgi:hypothetical protein